MILLILQNVSKNPSTFNTLNTISNLNLTASGSGTPSSVAKTSASGNNKETADRLDMPPPPSPASSTCSDTGSVNSHKRTKRAAPKEENENTKKDEEAWLLK